MAQGVCPQGHNCIADTPCHAWNNGLPTPNVSIQKASLLPQIYYTRFGLARIKKFVFICKGSNVLMKYCFGPKIIPTFDCL